MSPGGSQRRREQKPGLRLRRKHLGGRHSQRRHDIIRVGMQQLLLPLVFSASFWLLGGCRIMVVVTQEGGAPTFLKEESLELREMVLLQPKALADLAKMGRQGGIIAPRLRNSILLWMLLLLGGGVLLLLIILSCFFVLALVRGRRRPGLVEAVLLLVSPPTTLLVRPSIIILPLGLLLPAPPPERRVRGVDGVLDLAQRLRELFRSASGKNALADVAIEDVSKEET